MVVPVVNRQISSTLNNRGELVKVVGVKAKRQSESRIFSRAKKKSQLVKERFEKEKVQKASAETPDPVAKEKFLAQL